LSRALQRTMPFYAVAIGLKPGIYQTWPECEAQVKGVKYSRYKKFSTLAEAKEFCAINGKKKENCEKAQSTQSSATSNKRKYSSDDSSSSLSSNNNNSTASSFRWIPAGSKDDYSDTVIVYTDGACTANGTKNARAGKLSL